MNLDPLTEIREARTRCAACKRPTEGAPDTIPGGLSLAVTSPTVVPSSHVVAMLPSTWWIATNGESEPCVWEPMPAGPRLVISKSLAGYALWRVLARALHDRGTCEHCTAEPCGHHGGQG